MRIAIAGIHNEASSFSEHRADHDFFRYDRGDALLAGYEFDAQVGADKMADVELIPIMVAMGGASGLVLPEVYDAIEAEVVAGLRAAGPLDGVYLHMHGAVCVEGREGAEERFVGAVREVVGDAPIIGMSMDPHGNLSRELISLVDIATVHRFSPHIDNRLTPGRTMTRIVDAIASGIRPVTAWVRIPSLLPGERTGTFVEPGASVFGLVEEQIAAHDGVDDAGLWVGFAWADEPRNAAAAVAGGTDTAAVTAVAERLARAYWDAREDFAIVSEHAGSFGDAVDFLLTSPPAPLFISDSGDNVTAGSSGDITYALTEALGHEVLAASGVRVLVAGIKDPDAVAAAIEVGAGGVLDRAIGANEDARFAPPVDGPWEIVEIVEGRQGEGVTGALLRQGHVDVTVQTTRQRFVGADDPSASHNGTPNAVIVPVDGYGAVVVKNGYLFPTQVAQAGSEFMALTPGGTELDFDRLAFTRRATPLFPFEREFTPDLTAWIVERKDA